MITQRRYFLTADGLKKQVSKGTLTISGSNDILTLPLGTPKHGGRARGVEAGESVMEVVREDTLRIEARAKETI
ncbi:unnamed protein product [Prunus armeniaca]